MARLASARRPKDGRSRCLDRPARRYLPDGPGSPSAVGPRPAPDGGALPATPGHSPAGETAASVTPDNCWASLPAAERERFGMRLSRLVLRAVWTSEGNSQEDC
jgi:hypothetical protein